MKALFLFLTMAMALSLSAQELLISPSVQKASERALQIGGYFTGEDSAYVQVYHDGKELKEEFRVHTWELSLGMYEHYVIKFTDPQGRVKRLYIIELSDDLLEFVVPLEIDFDVVGNLLLVKQRDGKPDFLEFDVGMSRKNPQ